MKSFIAAASLLSLWSAAAGAQQATALSPAVQRYVSVGTPRVLLTHLRLIDGSGGPAQADRNIEIADGRIVAIGPGADVPPAAGTTVLDLAGRSVFPGIVGMHDHLFYMAQPDLDADWHWEEPYLITQMSYSAPRLYLAGGVTTMRTTGSAEPDTDLGLKRQIEAGTLPGPHLDVSGPYLQGANSYFLEMRPLVGAADARETVDYWAARGVTSFKAYTDITRDELRAAVEAAHAHGLKVTGHLCSVSYPEAAAIGIDNLEHGFFVNTQLDPGKQPDTCSESGGEYTLAHMSPDGAEARALIRTLVDHHVAVTSTLPVFESDIPGRPPLRPAALAALTPQAREALLYRRERPAGRRAPADAAVLLRRDMDLERAFVAAGGLLLSGPDPTGDGNVLPGFGDQRGIELLVEAGFSPVEAIRIATLNGATYLGRQAEIGSIAPGKHADLVVVRGNPDERIGDIENVELVFKDGVGYDPGRLLEAVRGRYGLY
jgi:imidazolonepropionase-like amidohydrolase